MPSFKNIGFGLFGLLYIASSAALAWEISKKKSSRDKKSALKKYNKKLLERRVLMFKELTDVEKLNFKKDIIIDRKYALRLVRKMQILGKVRDDVVVILDSSQGCLNVLNVFFKWNATGPDTTIAHLLNKNIRGGVRIVPKRAVYVTPYNFRGEGAPYNLTLSQALISTPIEVKNDKGMEKLVHLLQKDGKLDTKMTFSIANKNALKALNAVWKAYVDRTKENVWDYVKVKNLLQPLIMSWKINKKFVFKPYDYNENTKYIKGTIYDAIYPPK